MGAIALSELQKDALQLAREARRLASAAEGLTFQLERGVAGPEAEQDCRTLRDQAAAASAAFDAFVAEARRARRSEWLVLVSSLFGALRALSHVASEARWVAPLLPHWELAAAGAAPSPFAGAFLDGVELVAKNYRLLLKSGALPAGFPRLR